MSNTYKNWKGDDIDISMLEDSRLVALYRFLLSYLKSIKNSDSKKDIESIKDASKALIKERGLKMKDYT